MENIHVVLGVNWIYPAAKSIDINKIALYGRSVKQCQSVIYSATHCEREKISVSVVHVLALWRFCDSDVVSCKCHNLLTLT